MIDGWVEGAIALMTALSPLIAVLSPIILAVLVFVTARSNAAAAAAAHQAEVASKMANTNALRAAEGTRQVAITLHETATIQDAKVDNLTKKVNGVHVLVDGALGAMKEIAANALRQVADMTGDPMDTRTADLAERDAILHNERLAEVNQIAHLTALRANATEESSGFAAPAAPTTLPTSAPPAPVTPAPPPHHRPETLAEAWGPETAPPITQERKE